MRRQSIRNACGNSLRHPPARIRCTLSLPGETCRHTEEKLKSRASGQRVTVDWRGIYVGMGRTSNNAQMTMCYLWAKSGHGGSLLTNSINADAWRACIEIVMNRLQCSSYYLFLHSFFFVFARSGNVLKKSYIVLYFLVYNALSLCLSLLCSVRSSNVRALERLARNLIFMLINCTSRAHVSYMPAAANEHRRTMPRCRRKYVHTIFANTEDGGNARSN